MEDWKDEDKTEAYRSAEIMAAIMNQPVFGYTRENIVTAKQLLGEEEAVSAVGSPAALVEFIKIGAAVQKKEREARNA